MNTRIKRIRQTLHMNQDSFGDRIGVKKSSVSMLESGKNSPSEQTVRLICKEFNVNETWLRTGEGEMFLPGPQSVLEEVSEKLNLNAFETAFLKVYMRLPKQQRDNFCNGLYDEFFKLSQSDTVPEESRWEQEARLLQEEADAVKKDGEKCSASPHTKEA